MASHAKGPLGLGFSFNRRGPELQPVLKLGTFSSSQLCPFSQHRDKISDQQGCWAAAVHLQGHCGRRPRPGKLAEAGVCPVLSRPGCLTSSSLFSSLNLGSLGYRVRGHFRLARLVKRPKGDNVRGASRETRPTWVQVLALQGPYSKGSNKSLSLPKPQVPCLQNWDERPTSACCYKD